MCMDTVLHVPPIPCMIQGSRGFEFDDYRIPTISILNAKEKDIERLHPLGDGALATWDL